MLGSPRSKGTTASKDNFEKLARSMAGLLLARARLQIFYQDVLLVE